MSQEANATGTHARSQLLRLVWPFVLVVLLQSLLASGSLYLHSAVRAYVAGESLWSKGLKDAIHYLDLYAQTGEPEHLAEYQQAIAVPLGDHVFRQALDQPVPDLAVARQGILRGKNHPDDVDSMIWLYRHFRQLSYLERAIEQWAQGDHYVLQLEALADEILQGRQWRADAEDIVPTWRARIDTINRGATLAAESFSQILGEASRVVVRVLIVTNLLSATLLISLALWRTRKLLAEREAADQALELVKQRAQAILASIGDAVISLTSDGRIAYMNAAAEQLTGSTLQQAQGQPFERLFSIVDEQSSATEQPLLEQILGSGAAGDYAKLIVRPDGSSVAVNLVGTPVQERGLVSGVVMVLHDMTRERQFVASLSWQASHDALTGLANRREFEYRLAQLLARMLRQPGRHALMFIDLDQFKLVNDTCGHAAGDELLRQVCEALQAHLREGDTLARLGGDEFGVILENCPSDAALRVAEALRVAVQDLRFAWGERLFSISASIGVVQVPPGQVSLADLLRTADLACYSAKERGRNRVHAYQPGDTELSERVGEMSWVQRIQRALEENRFRLYAQPIVPLRSGEEGGHVEILLRLQDEDGTLIAPGSFIPAAERYGLMPQIDRWVVRHTLQALARFHVEHPHAPLLHCAINLSGTSIGDRDFLAFLREQLAGQALAPQAICFEITETAAIANLADATHFINELKALGCRFSLDDFCAGMSSFMYLKHLPVDYLKIDGSFVRELLGDPIDRAMVEMINQIGHVMGKRTIAEFVETAEVLAALGEIGVDFAQGYHLGKPQPLAGLLAIPEPLFATGLAAD
ncbi:EAL domain-containing protein [Pseudomonas sp. GOM6]|uniref:EAL domain-containing protein n=1 Tax=Pseudomonas sp. GOM6 TaxID=3036944 RepID=UPI002409D95A|nr:EAL domain-containing protein [Pseudomonas sp. GOM6]MDG1582250.1 EAL domain-containing protein [Pseudomonas sp. GOM6]